MDKMIIIML